MSLRVKKTVIVAPLNWGLGHATRCIPLIEAFERAGATVILASDGGALDLLKREFPHLRALELPAYNIRYPFRSMLLSMAIQGHKILRGGILEYFWLKKILKEEKIDAVISDNRFGFFNRSTVSVFMTHQVQILMPFRFLQPLVNSVNHFFIRHFDKLWIPDRADRNNLAGDLAHGKFMDALSKKLPVQYLGTLSRMKYFSTEKKYHATIVLSGPEPQRAILEKKIFFQLEKMFLTNKLPPQYPNLFCFVRGTSTPKMSIKIKGQDFIELHDVLTTAELNQKIMESDVVICRSGYSSLMDLVALQKRAILIPTEGQTEQEYLADILAAQNRFICHEQNTLNLEKALSEFPHTRGFKDFLQENCDKDKTLEQVVRELLKI
ncbi:MAG: glycosyltransferase [Saprospiraceae bacterium]|nr:glycosyltransferase [Saprospiraceae bacterium]